MHYCVSGVTSVSLLAAAVTVFFTVYYIYSQQLLFWTALFRGRALTTVLSFVVQFATLWSLPNFCFLVISQACTCYSCTRMCVYACISSVSHINYTIYEHLSSNSRILQKSKIGLKLLWSESQHKNQNVLHSKLKTAKGNTNCSYVFLHFCFWNRGNIVPCSSRCKTAYQ